MAAIQVESSDRVRAMHQELSARGVPFLVEPQAYPWNAYACYFTDPEDNLWEIYTWQEGGHANLISSGETDAHQRPGLPATFIRQDSVCAFL